MTTDNEGGRDGAPPPERLGLAFRRRRTHRTWRATASPLRTPAEIVALAYLAAVATGTVLLRLPVATTAHRSPPMSTALFTATSAVSVTGLSTVDTQAYWSGFGQAVVLALVELGGLGIMAFASLMGLLVSGRLGLRSRLLAQAETRTIDVGTVRQVLSGVVGLCVTIQVAVWAALTLRFWLGHGEPAGRAVYLGLFHAVSAFNNAGFTLWSDSLANFASDPWLLLPIVLALVLGGLGYPVLLELTRVHQTRLWSLHTRLTLVTSAVLLVVGPVVFMLSEWHNPGTLGPMHWPTKVLSAVFNGISPRTAGFSTVDFGKTEPGTQLSTELLMFIGGGSAGTAGGIKVTTLAVLVLAVVTEIRGDPEVDVFRRRIAPSTVRQAIAVVILSAVLVIGCTFVLLEITRRPLDDMLFETVSAFSNTGLSTGVTSSLPTSSTYLLSALMLVGRIGPIMAATALALRQSRRRYRHPEGRPLVG